MCPFIFCALIEFDLYTFLSSLNVVLLLSVSSYYVPFFEIDYHVNRFFSQTNDYALPHRFLSQQIIFAFLLSLYRGSPNGRHRDKFSINLAEMLVRLIHSVRFSNRRIMMSGFFLGLIS